MPGPKKQKPFNGVGELLIALDSEYIELSKLREKLKWNIQTLYNRLNTLEQLNLIENYYEDKAPGRRFIRLTEKGLKIKKLLMQIYEILETE